MTDFLFEASIYLAAILLVAPISAWLGGGTVLGYLGAGILIGPVLGIAGSSEAHSVQHFAEFGVVMMMFIIGLEMRPSHLWDMRRQLVGMGFVQVGATMAAVAAIVHWMGQPWTTAVAVGMVVSISSTAIVMQTFAEKKLSHTKGGQASFAILLSQDILAILMMVALPLMAGAAATEEQPGILDDVPGWAAVAVGVATIGLVLLIGRLVMPLLARFVHRARIRELDVALALFMVISISTLMSAIGLSPALGAFLAGVMLADSGMRHDLEGHLEPFKGILLGIFFVAIGALMDFGVLASMPGLIIGCTLGVIAIKAVVLNLVARAAGLAGGDRSLVTLSLAQAGEFSLVIISLATSLAVISPRDAAPLTLIVALSMLLTPLLFQLHARITALGRVTGGSIEEISGGGEGHVIIAGMGRFGQVVHRVATMNGLKTTIVDSDAEMVRLVRSFGLDVQYGDPARGETLRAAGLDKATVLAVCIDGAEAALRIVETARRARPDLPIVARARDREHAFALRHAGASYVAKELMDSALRVSERMLIASGLERDMAQESIAIYRRVEDESWNELFDAWDPSTPSDRNPAFMAARQRAVDGLSQAMADAVAARSAVLHPEIEPEVATLAPPQAVA